MNTTHCAARVSDQTGKYVLPTAESGLAALASATDMPENLVLWLPDPNGDSSYPIVSYTWLLCYKDSSDPAKAAALKELVRYCMVEGQKASESLGYIPLPDHVKERVLQALGTATADSASTP